MWFNFLISRGLIPDSLLRRGVRGQGKQRLDMMKNSDLKKDYELFLKEASYGEIAVHTDDANNQHYEVDSEFFQYCLGKNLKYSSCYWNDDTSSLDEAEEIMLDLYCKRAKIKDHGLNFSRAQLTIAYLCAGEKNKLGQVKRNLRNITNKLFDSEDLEKSRDWSYNMAVANYDYSTKMLIRLNPGSDKWISKAKQSKLPVNNYIEEVLRKYIFNESNLDKQSINVERFNQVENLITDNKKEKAPIQNKNKKLEI